MSLIFSLQTVKTIEHCNDNHSDQGWQQHPSPFQVHVPGLMGWALYTVIILSCMKAGVDFAVLKGLRSTAHLLNHKKTQCSISDPSSPETWDCSILQASFVHHSNFLMIFSLEFPAYCNSCVYRRNDLALRSPVTTPFHIALLLLPFGKGVTLAAAFIFIPIQSLAAPLWCFLPSLSFLLCFDGSLLQAQVRSCCDDLPQSNVLLVTGTSAVEAGSVLL